MGAIRDVVVLNGCRMVGSQAVADRAIGEIQSGKSRSTDFFSLKASDPMRHTNEIWVSSV
jgi:hypothetical protein